MTWYENVVRVCMGIQPGERVLLITDKKLAKEQDQLAEIIESLEPAEFIRWTLPEKERPLKTAPDDILEAVRTFDVGIHFLGTTSVEEQPYRLSLVKAAAEGGTIRFSAGLHIDQDIIDNELSADYEEISDITHRLYNHLQGASEVHLTSPLGTDLRMSIKGRPVAVDPGIMRDPGYYNLPAGECYVAPLENSANGKLVIDKSFPGILIKDPITLLFEKGRVVDVKGGKEAKALLKQIKAAEKQKNGNGTRTIAELGIGTNTAARITGNVMTDEKVLGTVHIAIGHNAVKPYNGVNHAPIHLDGVMGDPTLVIDGETLIENGNYLI